MLRSLDILSFVQYSKSRFSDDTILKLNRVSDMVQTDINLFGLKVILDGLVLEKKGHVGSTKSVYFVIDVPIPKQFSKFLLSLFLLAHSG